MRVELKRLTAALWSVLGLVGAVLTAGAIVTFIASSGPAPWLVTAAVLVVATAVFVHDGRLIREKDREIAQLGQENARPPSPIHALYTWDEWRRDRQRQSAEDSRDRQKEDRETRRRALDGLQQEYVETFAGTDDVTPAIRAGTTPPPLEWAKQRLTEMFPSEDRRFWLFHDYFSEELHARMTEARRRHSSERPDASAPARLSTGVGRNGSDQPRLDPTS